MKAFQPWLQMKKKITNDVALSDRPERFQVLLYSAPLLQCISLMLISTSRPWKKRFAVFPWLFFYFNHENIHLNFPELKCPLLNPLFYLPVDPKACYFYHICDFGHRLIHDLLLFWLSSFVCFLKLSTFFCSIFIWRRVFLLYLFAEWPWHQ